MSSGNIKLTDFGLAKDLEDSLGTISISYFKTMYKSYGVGMANTFVGTVQFAKVNVFIYWTC